MIFTEKAVRAEGELGSAILVVFLTLSALGFVLTLTGPSVRHSLASLAELTPVIEGEGSVEGELFSPLEAAAKHPLRTAATPRLYLRGSSTSRDYLIAYRRTPAGVLLPDWARLKRMARDSCAAWSDEVEDLPGLLSSRTCTRLSSSENNIIHIPGNLSLNTPLTIASSFEADLVVFGSLTMSRLDISAAPESRVHILVVGSIRIDELMITAGSGAKILVHSSTGSVDLGESSSDLCSSVRNVAPEALLTIQSYRGRHRDGGVRGVRSCSSKVIEVQSSELRLIGSLRSALAE